ncbi:MAG: EAL domain-containing protein, partial [Spirochaetia bacterium]|nr:EAL domain-containing protein [Spirochaetia bacterium]
ESAVARLRESGKKTRLFINMMPRILSSVYADLVVDPFKMHLINLVHKYDIEPNMIVVEITEDEFAGDIARLVAIVEMFKKSGFQIAVDDVGSGMSDLSRIAYIMPDIIKVDLQLLQRSVTQVGFRQVLQAVSYLSHRIGASLLFEGIEQEEELTLALKMGARFLQGFLFSQATADFQDKTRFRKYLEGILQENSIFRIADTMYGFQVRDDVVRSLKKLFVEIDPQSRGISAMIQNLLPRLPDLTQRIALYDPKGNQVSAVFQREARGSWSRDDSTISHNISWRPFFLQAIAQKEHSGQEWFVSEPYHDLRSPFPRVNLCLVQESNFVFVVELEWRT